MLQIEFTSQPDTARLLRDAQDQVPLDISVD